MDDSHYGQTRGGCNIRLSLGQMRPSIFSFSMTPQFVLEPVNEGQHERYLGHRVTYSPDILRFEKETPLRYSIPTSILTNDYLQEAQRTRLKTVRGTRALSCSKTLGFKTNPTLSL